MKSKKVRGYIFSRSFMGERVPQHVQNIVIRDYCEKNNLEPDSIGRLITKGLKQKIEANARFRS